MEETPAPGKQGNGHHEKGQGQKRKGKGDLTLPKGMHRIEQASTGNEDTKNDQDVSQQNKNKVKSLEDFSLLLQQETVKQAGAGEPGEKRGSFNWVHAQ